jgi:hypothetical protein
MRVTSSSQMPRRPCQGAYGIPLISRGACRPFKAARQGLCRPPSLKNEYTIMVDMGRQMKNNPLNQIKIRNRVFRSCDAPVHTPAGTAILSFHALLQYILPIDLAVDFLPRPTPKGMGRPNPEFRVRRNHIVFPGPSRPRIIRGRQYIDGEETLR